ncbi:Hypothetical protein, putative [Bodo saltans]|uniref:Uncharacterized protein n=1 Tax=Bodo saltans TaxID=75058 RepID=A0A0S4KLM9_BODSA|nr:Hypothetical protein, putative [Bodo saltans]|eukprot:CUI15318.1 Hypothetical protein, putative [Bodo saltans]
MVAWMGRCIPIIAPGGGCDDRGAQQKYLIDVYCILPSDVHQMDGITAFIQGTTSPHDHFMDRPHFSSNVSGVGISCRVPHRSTESSSLWEAVRCWTSVFEAFSLHCPSCPPGWIMESQGINVPVLIVCVMISAALPNCSLHLACVTSGASSQMNYLCSLMRRLELATAGNVRSVGYTNADRRLMPATVSTSSGTTCRAGTLTVCARSGEVAFVGDLDRYSPSVLRLLRMNMLRTSLSGVPASKEGEERGVSSNCTTPSSIAFVGGRASSSSRETCVEEYLADCDLLTGFSRPPPAAMVCQQLSAFYQQQRAKSDEASSSSSHDSSVDSSWQILSMLLHPDVTSLFTLPELSPGATLLLDRYFVTHCTSSCNRNSAMSTLVKIASAHATFRTAWNLLATQHEQRTLAGKLLQLQQDLRSALEAAEVLSVDAFFAICSVRECSQRIHGHSEHHTGNDGSNGVVFTAPSPADVVLPQSTSRLMQEVIDAAHQVHNDLRTSSSPVAEASLHNWWLQSYVDGIVSC